MSGDETDRERGFVVIDRRAGAEGEKEGECDQGRAQAREEAPQLPAIDFCTFVLSLGTSALFHMGLVPDPQTGKPVAEPSLPMARQTIDTLEMLEEKTRGNLDEEERKLLQSLLYEVRMRFVEAGRSAE